MDSARITRAPTSPRSIGFCAIWDCISSSSSSSARHTEKLMGPNQESTSLFVCPEVLRTSRGADAPAFVAMDWTGLLEQ